MWEPIIIWVPEPVVPKVSERRVLETAGLRAPMIPMSCRPCKSLGLYRTWLIWALEVPGPSLYITFYGSLYT